MSLPALTLKIQWITIPFIFVLFFQVSLKSPKRFEAGITGSPVSLKTCFVDDENVPCSPTPSAVPETPDSLRTENPSDISYENRSPVSRGLHTKGVRGKPSLMARKLMQPRNSSSPESKDTFELKNGLSHSGSVKRLLHSSENIQSAKRSKIMQVQELPECDASLPETKRNESLRTLSVMFHKSPEKKIKAESVSIESSRLANGPCVKTIGKTNGLSKLSKKSSNQLTFSTCEKEKENLLAHKVKPEIGMGAVSGTNDLDLVMSYSSWIKNGSTEEKETFLNCPITKKRPLSTAELQVKEKIDGKTSPAPFEDDFTDLMDEWFDDGMEQKSEAPKPKKFSHEYEYFIQPIYIYMIFVY